VESGDPPRSLSHVLIRFGNKSRPSSAGNNFMHMSSEHIEFIIAEKGVQGKQYFGELKFHNAAHGLSKVKKARFARVAFSMLQSLLLGSRYTV